MRITGQESDRGSGLAIRGLRGDARQLEPSEFEDRHGSAFLMLSAAELTLMHGPDSTEVRLADDAPVSGESTAALALMVYPLRGQRGEGDVITLGRAPTNDVVIPDVSISRMHAFVRAAEGRSWRMLDAGSTNGTTVNGSYVPQRGAGQAVELKSGDNVRLGQVELTFLDVKALLAFIAKLER